MDSVSSQEHSTHLVLTIQSVLLGISASKLLVRLLLSLAPSVLRKLTALSITTVTLLLNDVWLVLQPEHLALYL